MSLLDDALAIRRRQKSLKDIPEKERPVVARLLKKTGLLGHHARSQAAPARSFGHAPLRSVLAR